MIPKDADAFSMKSGKFMEAGNENTPDYLDVSFKASGDGITIYDGSFDVNEFRNELEVQGYEKGDCEGVETWEIEYGTYLIAMIDGKIVSGEESDVKSCIEVVNGGQDSFYVNEEVKTLLGELSYTDRVEVNMVSGHSSAVLRRGPHLGRCWTTTRKDGTYRGFLSTRMVKLPKMLLTLLKVPWEALNVRIGI